MKKSVIFIIVSVILVIGVYITRYINSPVETCVARISEYEKVVSGEALFVRKENVYNAGTSGTFYTYAEEGARVGKDRLLATVYDGVVDNQLLQEINNLDKKISDYRDYAKESYFSGDTANVEGRLKNFKDKIIDAREKGEPSEIVRIKNNMKSIISGSEPADIQSEIDILLRQKKSLENKLGYSKKNIYSDCSGVFSSHIDGLEGMLTVEKLNKYSVQDFLDASDGTEDKHVTKDGALEGDAVCKVIDNHVWYILAKVDAEYISEMKKGIKAELRFGNIPGVEASAKLIHISEPEEDSAVLVFECENYIEGVFSIRSTDIEIILEQYRGYEIPIYAVRVKDSKQGVMVQYGINEVFKPCKIIYTDREKDTVIISPITENVSNPLEEYDKIVIGEKVEDERGNNSQ